MCTHEIGELLLCHIFCPRRTCAKWLILMCDTCVAWLFCCMCDICVTQFFHVYSRDWGIASMSHFFFPPSNMCEMTDCDVRHICNVTFLFDSHDWNVVPVLHFFIWREHVWRESSDMTHPYVWRIHVCDLIYSYVRHDSFISVTWLIHMCDRTHWYVWHDSFICVTWLIHMCDWTHS